MKILILLVWAVVNTSSVFMRESPSYTSENVSQSRMGVPVEVLESKGYWVKIRTPEPYEGWVNELTLAPMPEDYASAKRYICIVEHSHIYAEPFHGAERLSDFSMGDIILQAGKPVEGWSPVQLWDGRKGYVPSFAVADFEKHMSRKHKDLAEDIVACARRFLGSPYLWGGMSAGLFDCSGLVGFSYFMNGVQLPRDSSEQIKCGIPVEFEDMQAGDLVFFGENRVAHVALCTGPGRIIHSSQIVRENSLVKGSPDYYGRNILGIRRIIGNYSNVSFVRKLSLYFAD